MMNESGVLTTSVLLKLCKPRDLQAKCLSYLVVFPGCLFLLLLLMHHGL